MKHELIKTENYLLVVSGVEIKEADWCYYSNRHGGGNIVCQAYKHHSSARMLFDRGNHNREIGEGITPLNDECKKIIAHLPLNGAERLEGVDLLPSIPKEEYNIEQMSIEHSASELSMYPETSSTLTKSEVLRLRSLIQAHSYRGFKKGYNKAKETYKYTEKDMEKALLKMAQKCREEMDLSLSSYVNNISKNSDEIIQSLNQPKLPIAFECEMIEIEDDLGPLGHTSYPTFSEIPKTITNSEGRTEWVGKYGFYSEHKF